MESQYLRFPVGPLQLVDSVPADKQAGEEGVAVDAVVGPGQGNHQQEGEQDDHQPHVGSLIIPW